MKNNKLIILYIIMLLIGLALLFTSPSDSPPVEPPTQPREVEVIVAPPPKPVTEMVNVAVAKTDISSNTILKAKDYYFKTIEVNIDTFDKAKYVLDAGEIENYATKNNIQKESLIQKNLIASPYSEEYRTLTLKKGEFIFPVEIAKADIYLLKNLHIGDLIDIYVLYGLEKQGVEASIDNANVVSPSRNFSNTTIKPIIAGKKILYIENADTNSSYDSQRLGRIDLVLTNEEIKLVRTLMTNSIVMLYPSTFNESFDKGLFLLADKEKTWPESKQQIFNRKPISRLRGN
ncbi:hypothetical protein FcAc13_06685 [Frischella sp. Ac13]|uniref:Flp pilus assembly protein CpaB n=1 Tax=Frischella japonica TaxID=2741544 RepID=A0ABR7QY58_9GAMM|nr:SAF domain-containing protein [Frischella japonica]MBC9130996.1 hypothetical protein [Frischella japonica]